jgi:iron complex outermembrane recepter protein
VLTPTADIGDWYARKLKLVNMTNRNVRRRLAPYAIGAAAASLILSSAGYAQTGSDVVTLDEYFVTGSLIPIAADTPAVPIIVISSQDIDDLGIRTSVLDLLKRSVPQFTGNANLGSDNGNIASGATNGGSQIALRGRSTLVLVNGRRMAVSPVVASNGFQFVDVNMIPVSAVERIEILSDGASATYGSDAVSGVVNVILKTNFRGTEVGGYYGFDDANEYQERGYSAVVGGGTDKSNVTASIEWFKSDPLIQAQRPFARGIFRTVSYAGMTNLPTFDEVLGDFPFYYLNPNLNAPPQNLDLTPAQLVAQGIYSGPYNQDQATQFFDLANYPTMIIGNERRSITIAADHRLSDSATLFADLIYSNTETFSQLNAQPVSGAVAASNPNNPFDRTVTARNRFAAFPRKYFADTTSIRGVVGSRGRLSDRITYELAGSWNRVEQDFQNHNLIDTNAYNAAVTAGTYNPFAFTQAPGVIEGFVGVGYGDYYSGLYSWDGRLVADTFNLPGGVMKVAVGAESRREKLDFMNDRNSRLGLWLQATPRQPFKANRKTDGLFAEVRAPLFSPENEIKLAHTLEVSAAIRNERYSDTANPTVPKVSFRWLPVNDQFAFRGTYSEAFSAPTLYDLRGPTSVGFTPGTRLDRYDTSGNSLNVQTGSRQYRSRGGSNANLIPSESENITFGVVLTPKALKGVSLSVDYFKIKEVDLVSSIGSSRILQSVERLGAASPYHGLVRFGEATAGEVRFDSGSLATTPGQVTASASDNVWVSNSLINIAGLTQEGYDVRFNYVRETENLGTFDFVTNVAIIDKFIFQSLRDTAPFDYAGTFTEGFGVVPDYSLSSSLTWRYSDWRWFVGSRFIPGVDDVSADYKVESWWTWDLSASYSFTNSKMSMLKGLTLQVGVNNIANEMTNYVPSEGDQSADQNAYPPIGRFFYVNATYRF